jgi:biopolymer transport protein ExbD
MANKPSGSSNRIRPDDGINLTPMIDMITCLMFFLMMFASIMPVVIIDAPLPKVASTAEEVKKAKDQDNKLELMVYVSMTNLRVKTDWGTKEFPAVNGKFPWDEFHKYLIGLKGKRPNAKEITLMPSDDVTYEVMVGVMDAAREMTKGDADFKPVPPEIAMKPESEQFNRLFPDVSIGGI